MLKTTALSAAILTPTGELPALPPVAPLMRKVEVAGPDRDVLRGLVPPGAFEVPGVHFVHHQQEQQDPDGQNETRQIENAKRKAAAPALQSLENGERISLDDLKSVVEGSTLGKADRERAMKALRVSYRDVDVVAGIKMLIADGQALDASVGLEFLAEHLGPNGLFTSSRVARELIQESDQGIDGVCNGLTRWSEKLLAKNEGVVFNVIAAAQLREPAIERLRAPILDRGTVSALTGLLEATGGPSTELLQEFLGSKHAYLRERGADVMYVLNQTKNDCFVGTDELTSLLKLAVTDPDSNVRVAAVRVIVGMTPAPNTNATLIRSTKDPNHDVRRSALAATAASNSDTKVAEAFRALLFDDNQEVVKRALDWGLMQYKPANDKEKGLLRDSIAKVARENPNEETLTLVRRFTEREACEIEDKKVILDALDKNPNAPKVIEVPWYTIPIGVGTLLTGIVGFFGVRAFVRRNEKKKDSRDEGAEQPD